MPVFERETLPNGVRLLTAPMSHAQSTACFLFLAAGSRYETADTRGLAHFTEHMVFKGTERRPTGRALSSELDAIGALSNAATSKEYTFYWVKCAAGYADTALDVLVDMLRNSKFDPEEIEREKGVIVEEQNGRLDTPRDYVDELWEQFLYGDQPLGWRTLGTAETVRAARRESFLDYVDRWYEPLRIVVGVAGHIDPDLRERVQGLLGDLGRGPATGPEAVREADGGARVHLETRQQADQAHLCLGVRSYPLGHPDRYVLQLLATVLGGGMSSRLFEEVRERRGLAYTIFALNHSHTDAGSLWAQAGVDVVRVDEAVSTIVGELHRVAEEPVPEDELDKARNYAKGRFVFSLETPQGLMNYGLRREVLEGRSAEPDEVVAGLDAVTPADMQRVAQDILGRNGLRLALIGPYDDADRFERLLG